MKQKPMTIEQRIEAEHCGIETSYGEIEGGVDELRAALKRMHALIRAVQTEGEHRPKGWQVDTVVAIRLDEMVKHGDIPEFDRATLTT